jgi:hypothetical protein
MFGTATQLPEANSLVLTVVGFVSLAFPLLHPPKRFRNAT